MSRIRVLNLPKNLDESDVRKFFTSKLPQGAPPMEITDICIKKDRRDPTKTRVLFVGFKTAEAATFAVRHFNQTYFKTSKISVETAMGLADAPLRHKEKTKKLALAQEERRKRAAEKCERDANASAFVDPNKAGGRGKEDDAEGKRREEFVKAGTEASGGKDKRRTATGYGAAASSAANNNTKTADADANDNVNVGDDDDAHKPQAAISFTPFNIFDLSAYPPHSSAAETHLVSQLQGFGKLPKGYVAFVAMWEEESAEFTEDASEAWHSFAKPGMVSSFGFIKAAEPITDATKAEEYLTNMLGNVDDKSSTPLVERKGQMGTVTEFVSSYLSSAKNKKGLAVLFSTRGSGKTQLLKCALHSCAAKPVARGYVLVCECGVSSMYFDEIRTLNMSGCTKADINAFLVALIRRHVATHLGAGVKAADATVVDAFAAWRAACGDEYRPLIVFDTAEELPPKTSVVGEKGNVLTILEALVTCLPSGHGMLAFGARHISTCEVRDPTDVRLVCMDRLPRLSLAGYSKALRVWSSGSVRSRKVTCTQRVLHMVCGGVPRLLRWSMQKMEAHYCEYLEVWGTVIARCVGMCARAVTLSSESAVNTMLVMAALASGTKTTVNATTAMPLVTPAVSWESAQRGLLFDDDDGLPLLPPALLLSGHPRRLSDSLAAGARALPVADKLRLMWPPGLDFRLMHCPVDLDELEKLHVTGLVAAARGRPWEIQAAHCTVGRWLYLRLTSRRKETSIPLSQVFAVSSGPTFDALKDVEVDFSGGVSQMACDKSDPAAGERCFFLNSNPNGHHDAKFRALRNKQPIVVCVQMWHGHEKTEEELTPQIFTSKESGGAKVDLLLVVQSSPPSSGAFKDKLLRKLAVRVDASLISRPSVLALLPDPA